MISRKHTLIVPIHILTLLARVSPIWGGESSQTASHPLFAIKFLHKLRWMQLFAPLQFYVRLQRNYFCLKFYAFQCASFAVCTWPVARVIRTQVKMKAGPKGQLIIYSYQGKKLCLKTAGLCFHTVTCCL